LQEQAGEKKKKKEKSTESSSLTALPAAGKKKKRSLCLPRCVAGHHGRRDQAWRKKKKYGTLLIAHACTEKAGAGGNGLERFFVLKRK